MGKYGWGVDRGLWAIVGGQVAGLHHTGEVWQNKKARQGFFIFLPLYFMYKHKVKIKQIIIFAGFGWLGTAFFAILSFIIAVF